VEDAAMAEEAAEQLHALLHHLPSDQRRVLELRAAGLRGEEIAVVLERSHAAIRMLQLRAVRHLRELLRVDEVPGTAP
jgi:DNA-directed RNA polymerase specialized sigma24 family protein